MARRGNIKGLKNVLRRHLKNAIKVKDVLYRVVNSAIIKNYGKEEVISGNGTKKFSSGRWMKKGVCYAVYLSFDVETALKEVIPKNTSKIPIYALCEINVSLNKVLDFTKIELHKEMSLNIKDVLEGSYAEEDREITSQSIGKMAYELGFNGMKVPSAVNPLGYNLIIFSKKLHPKGLSIRKTTFFESRKIH